MDLCTYIDWEMDTILYSYMFIIFIRPEHYITGIARHMLLANWYGYAIDIIAWDVDCYVYRFIWQYLYSIFSRRGCLSRLFDSDRKSHAFDLFHLEIQVIGP